MSATIKPRRGANLPTTTIDGELLVDTSNKRVYVASGAIGSNANLVAAASHGTTPGLVQFAGTSTGQFLSSSLYGVKLSGSTATSVFIGENGSAPIPLDFYTQSGQITVFGFRSPSSISTIPTYYNTWSPTQINYVLPNNLPDLAIAKSRWMLYIDSWNGASSTFQLKWANICSLCSLSVDTGGTSLGGIGFQGLYGQVLVTRAPTTNDDPDTDIYVTTADANALRYDFATNTVITPKVQATDTIESTGLVLKTGNTGKVKFVAESFVGSEVTVTVPSSASGGTIISTNNKISDLTADSWSNFSTKLSSGKQGTGDVVLKINSTLTTPTIENILSLTDATSAGYVRLTATAGLNCEIFDETAVNKISIGSASSQISMGGVSTSINFNGNTSLAKNVFTIGGISAPTSDTNKDKGVQFRWHNGSTAKLGFFGYDDSSGKMIFIPDATNTDDVISGTIGEINAKVEWANLLSVPSFATSSNNLGYFATTTSDQLRGVISDETGSGALVFGTSPSFTTSIDSGATFAAFASSTSLTLGYSSTASSTTNISTGAVGSGNTKTVNIGTSSASGSATNINIGAVDGATSIKSNTIYLGSSSSNTVIIDKTIPVTGGPTALSYVFGIEIDAAENYSVLTAESRLDENNKQYGVLKLGGTLFTTYNIAPSVDGAGDDDQFIVNLGVGTVGSIGGEKIINIGSGSNSNNTTAIYLGSTSGTSFVQVYGDLAVSGGDLTTSVTTATLFNSVATTLNLGGAATSITMGATSGATTTIRGGTLVGNTATQNLFNTTATTINFGGAATTMNIGATGSGTVTIGNNLFVTNKLEATVKSFVIDHPTKQGKKLRYACLEGPENGVYVRGKLDGENTIVLPEYWVNLVDEETITVNLTGIDSSGYHTVKKIENNKITVQSSSGNVNCYYVVYGERKDVSKLVTEFE